jgi:arylsulfatase A-like enzyme
MLSALDDGVGAVRQALQKAGVEDDTLIVFINDNGGPPQANASTNTPLSGAKATLLEGGIRVPLLMQWPNGIPQGKLYDRPVISLDILATSVAAAHGVLPQDRLIDGVDLMPYLHGQRRPPHKALFWAYQNGSAIRCGSWKLMKENDGKVRLFDLDHDIAESRDLAEKDPRRVKHLSAALAEWESQLKPPLWGPAARQSQQPRRRRKQP